MKPKIWAVISVFIGIAVFTVLVLAFYNFGYVERAVASDNHDVQRRLFDANTITFMSSFILVVLFSIFISTQDRLSIQSRKFEQQTKKMEDEKEKILSSMEHTRIVHSYIMDAQAICDKSIILIYMIESSLKNNMYSPNQSIRSAFSECSNGICDLQQKIENYKKKLDIHEKHDILSPLVASHHKFQAFQRFGKDKLDQVLSDCIDSLMKDFESIGVSA